MQLIKVSLKYIKRYPRMIALILGATLVGSVFDGASFGMLIPLIQSMTDTGASIFQKMSFGKYIEALLPSGNSTGSILAILILLFTMIVIKNVFVYTSLVLVTKLRFGIGRDLSVSLIGNIIEYDMKYFDRVKTGHILSNLSNETRRIGDFMMAILQFITVLARIVVFVILLFIISVKASIAVFVLIAMVLFPLEIITRKVKKHGSAISMALLAYTQKASEILTGIRLIKGNTTEELEKKQFGKMADDVARSQFDTVRYMHALIPISEVMIFGLIVACFFVTTRIVKIDIPAVFPLVATYLLVLAKALTQINQANNLRSVAIGNLAAFTTYDEMNDISDKKSIYGGTKKIEHLRDSIEFRNVVFSYNGLQDVLHNMSFRIPKGKVTAIVGMSGAGKSTIVNLIPRFYDCDSGEILIDAISVKDLELAGWRRKIGFVSQDTFIFNADVRYNISYGRGDMSDASVIKAARIANAHEFISNLPEGYKSVLGERGVMLSGGQRQRISIARAIIHDPEVLILDEATSSLDAETERLIKEAIDRVSEGRTVIAIAHRLSTIMHADSVVVIHDGKIVDQGSHSHLLRNSALYKKLYDAQFKLVEDK